MISGPALAGYCEALPNSALNLTVKLPPSSVAYPKVNATRSADKEARWVHENLGSLSMMEIRNAVLDDLDAITAVFVECFNAPPWSDGWSFDAARERIASILEAHHFRGAVAISDGNIIGLLLGQNERWVDAFHFSLQEEMCVLPDRQRSGVGRALLHHLTEQLRAEGTEKIYLITGPDSGAAAFYSAHGYYTSRGRIVMATRLERS
jgi:ribosomal protein S18 acetylase RimI-like enzyme